VYNGKKYRSTLEANTAQILDAMGLPWEYENKKITLQESFRCQYQKEKVRSIEYIPDFTIGPIMLETKGYETPDWKIKRKLLYRYLQQNEPETLFYQVKNLRQLLQPLDCHWSSLGYCIEVTPKPKAKKEDCTPKYFDSIKQAMQQLNLDNCPVGCVLRSLTGKTDYIHGYKWKIKRIKL
jgi:hypothetical protein